MLRTAPDRTLKSKGFFSEASLDRPLNHLFRRSARKAHHTSRCELVVILVRISSRRLKCFARLAYQPPQERESGGILCPPPADRCVQGDAHEYRGGHVGASDAFGRVSSQRAAADPLGDAALAPA